MLRQRNLLIFSLIVFCSISICFSVGCAKKGQVREEETEQVIEEEEVEPTPIEEPVKPPPEEEKTEVLEPKEIRFDMIYFDYDKYNLKPDARETLLETVETLRANSNVKIMIEGHCDERGTIEYNLQLGKKRAESARVFIIASGIDANRLNTISYGEEKPRALGHNERAWAKNRRDEFKIISK